MDNLFDISAMEKSTTAYAVEPVAPAQPAAPEAPATPTEPAAPQEPAAPAAPAPAADPAADPNTPPDSPTDPNIKPDPAAAPLPAADPATATPTEETEAARQRQQLALVAQENARKQLLTELGVESMDDLRTRLSPAEQETPEQKQRREDLHRANVQTYAVHKLNMSPDDFVQIQTAKEATDDALVFSAFREKWLPLAEQDPAFKDKDLDTEARFMFEQMFHINSENEALQRMGSLSLKESADQLRGTFNARYEQAEAEYRDYQASRNEAIKFKSLLENKLAQIPLERKWNVEDGGEVVFQLSKLDKEDLRKHLVSQDVFELFRAKGSQEASQLLDQRIESYIRFRFSDDMIATTIKTVRDITAAKATAGARAPFPIQPHAPASVINTGQITKEDDEKVARLVSRP